MRSLENAFVYGGTEISRGSVQMEKFGKVLWSSVWDYIEAKWWKLCTVFMPCLVASVTTEEWVGLGQVFFGLFSVVQLHSELSAFCQ